MDRLLEKYHGRIKIVSYQVSFSKQSFKAAEAALCAGSQGKYWEYHHRLFDRQEQWSDAADLAPRLEEYARGLGLNVQEFNACLRSGKMAKAVDRDKKLALSRNVRSTPTVFVGGKRIVGSQPLFLYERVIEGLLQSR